MFSKTGDIVRGIGVKVNALRKLGASIYLAPGRGFPLQVQLLWRYCEYRAGGIKDKKETNIANGGRDNLLVWLPSEALCNSDEVIALVLEHRDNIVQDVVAKPSVSQPMRVKGITRTQ